MLVNDLDDIRNVPPGNSFAGHWGGGSSRYDIRRGAILLRHAISLARQATIGGLRGERGFKKTRCAVRFLRLEMEYESTRGALPEGGS